MDFWSDLGGFFNDVWQGFLGLTNTEGAGAPVGNLSSALPECVTGSPATSPASCQVTITGAGIGMTSAGAGGGSDGSGSVAYNPGYGAPQPAQPQGKPAPRNPFVCGAAAASRISVAAAIHQLPGYQSGVGGFIADAVGGNIFSGATDLINSFATGSGGGHNGYYNIGQAAVAGPTVGFGAFLPKLAAANPGVVDMAEIGLVGTEYATGIGELKALYDGLTFLGTTAGCAAGRIQ